MGQLVAKHYPTKLFLGAADHTYVECGTGLKGWACWGGKKGGAVLRVGTGSTKRADAIAEPNEKAGITCYLINGVCHQAANRVLLPAGITVAGARGYGLSIAMFGHYGRPLPSHRLCKAPFNQHAGVAGDLPECIGAAPALKGATALASPNKTVKAAHRKYFSDVLKIYSEAGPMFTADSVSDTDLEDFHVELFARQAKFFLGERLRPATAGKLRDIRRSTERSRLKEEYYSREKLTRARFVEEFNRETVVFQHAVAGVLAADEYKRLFGLAPGETIVLADPAIVKMDQP